MEHKVEYKPKVTYQTVTEYAPRSVVQQAVDYTPMKQTVIGQDGSLQQSIINAAQPSKRLVTDYVA